MSLGLVVAEPGIIDLATLFMQPAEFSPRFMVHRPVGEKPSNEPDEGLFVHCAHPLHPATEEDVCAWVREVQFEDSRLELRNAGRTDG